MDSFKKRELDPDIFARIPEKSRTGARLFELNYQLLASMQVSVKSIITCRAF